MVDGAEYLPDLPGELYALVDGWLVLRDTGRTPWTCGIRVGRRRFWQAVRILSSITQGGELLLMRSRMTRLKQPLGCPLLGGD